MGVIWQAQLEESTKKVVVKEPQLGKVSEHVATERLFLESEILRAINDESNTQVSDTRQQLIRDHVVRYVDSSTQGPSPLLILEFISGPTMTRMINDHPLNQDLAMIHVESLLEVLDALHSGGVIHRDISPSNIILNPTRGIVLVDFGTCLARISGKPRYGKVIFKKGFSAPELLQGSSDARSDIFSVGAVMFYLLTGRNPCDFTSRSQKLNTTMSAFRGIPPSTSAIIETAMNADPNKRFHSASEMLKAIDSVMGTSGPMPHISFGSRVVELRPGVTDIGRDHNCDQTCRKFGFLRTPQVHIADPENFIEKHHARIWVEPNGRCFLEDLRSINRTAIASNGRELRVIEPSDRTELQDMDIVALAYTPKRGPYVTFQFRGKQKSTG